MVVVGLVVRPVSRKCHPTPNAEEIAVADHDRFRKR